MQPAWVAYLGCAANTGGASSPHVAMEGDTVTIHYVCRDEEGNVVDDSSWSEDPVSFEVGAGEVTGNPLFQVQPPPWVQLMHMHMPCRGRLGLDGALILVA